MTRHAYSYIVESTPWLSVNFKTNHPNEVVLPSSPSRLKGSQNIIPYYPIYLTSYQRSVCDS